MEALESLRTRLTGSVGAKRKSTEAGDPGEGREGSELECKYGDAGSRLRVELRLRDEEDDKRR